MIDKIEIKAQQQQQTILGGNVLEIFPGLFCIAEQ